LSDPLKVGIAGLGTVGGGVVKILAEHSDLLAKRCGRTIELGGVSALEMPGDLKNMLAGVPWYDNALDMAKADAIDVVVELIGGSDGIAKAVVETALGAGKSVVTANKALIAHHGLELGKSAEVNGGVLAFEAAVAGGIPILKAIRESLAANQLHTVYGILNGTCNYILTEMEQTGRDFADVLAEAQALGYAEADPSFDVDGIDSAHKLAILTSLSFGCPIDFDQVYVEGIRNITSMDIGFASELGYRIKLLAITKRTNGGVLQRVHPCMIKLDSPIASVYGVINAVVAEGDFVGRTVYEGAGAGERPTASAVVADLVDIARGISAPAFSVPVEYLEDLPEQPMESNSGTFYLRLMVVDESGVLAKVSEFLRDEGVSIETVLQRGRAPGETVPLILVTHEAEEAAMARVRAQLKTMAEVVEDPTLIRIEPL
jgi:homoserine dehydrogenase